MFKIASGNKSNTNATENEILNKQLKGSNNYNTILIQFQNTKEIEIFEKFLKQSKSRKF